MFCTHCGKEVTPLNAYCTECGAPAHNVGVPSSQSQSVKGTTSLQSPESPGNRSSSSDRVSTIRWIILVIGIVLALPMLWLGSALFHGGIEERAAQTAAAQRHATLVAARPMKVNPDSLVGTWYGRGGIRNEVEITLRITSDVRPHETPQNMFVHAENPYLHSTFGELELLGVGDCNYSNVSMSGSANDSGIGLGGYLGFSGEGRSKGSFTDWEDTDNLSLSGQLEATGMFGTISMKHIETGSPYQRPRSGCPANLTFPFKLSLVQDPAAANTSVLPSDSSNVQTTINSQPTRVTSAQQQVATDGTPEPQLLPSSVSKAEIEAAITQHRARGVMSKLWREQMRVFGVEDLGVFGNSSAGTASVSVQGDDFFFEGCSKADKCSVSAAFCLDLSSGKAAGAIARDGSPRIYLGNYPTREALPDSLKGWLVNLGSVRTPSGPTAERLDSPILRADASHINLTDCPSGSQHPQPEIHAVDRRRGFAFLGECYVDNVSIKSESDCERFDNIERFSLDAPGRCIAMLDECPVGWDTEWEDARVMWCFKQ